MMSTKRKYKYGKAIVTHTDMHSYIFTYIYTYIYIHIYIYIYILRVYKSMGTVITALEPIHIQGRNVDGMNRIWLWYKIRKQ